MDLCQNVDAIVPPFLATRPIQGYERKGNMNFVAYVRQCRRHFRQKTRIIRNLRMAEVFQCIFLLACLLFPYHSAICC